MSMDKTKSMKRTNGSSKMQSYYILSYLTKNYVSEIEIIHYYYT